MLYSILKIIPFYCIYSILCILYTTLVYRAKRVRPPAVAPLTILQTRLKSFFIIYYLLPNHCLSLLLLLSSSLSLPLPYRCYITVTE